jgi:ribosomal-protein-alanine N-acetyltransferase
MSIIIRKMKTSDIDAVYDIEQHCFSHPWSKESFRGELEKNVCARYLVAEEDNQVIGYGGMWLIINEAHITNIAVHPNHRKKKVGSILLSQLMGLAWNELEVQRMTLEVRKSNYVAQSLYKKFNFQVSGERKKYYDDNEDAIIMWCEDITPFVTNDC